MAGVRRARGLSLTGGLHTFVFADLAGFTALTEIHGDERAADLALEFCADLNRHLPEGAEDLKMLGDACLVRAERAADGVRLGLDLARAIAARHGFPDVRVGMHTGTAARRGDDWFGSAVNLAARVGQRAAPGEVLLTAATRDAAGELAGVAFADRGEHELRHVSRPVRLFAAEDVDTGRKGRWAVDPVCRMRVDVDRCAATLTHEGAEYAFCSTGCGAAFARDPERYAEPFGGGAPRVPPPASDG